MRLVCRECSAAYEAPDSLFGPQPREVRCNRCGYQWTVVGPAQAVNSGGEPAAAEPLTPAPALPAPAAPMPPFGSDAAPLPQSAPLALQEGTMPPSPAAPPVSPRPPESVPPAAAALRAGPAAASTRALIGEPPPEDEAEPVPDAEERRLSHELSFGETERPTVVRKSRGHSLRGVWLVILVILVVIIAAVLFKPQLVGAMPGLAGLYASVGL